MEVKFLSIKERDEIIDSIFAEVKNGQEVEPAIYQFKDAREWFDEFVMTNAHSLEEQTGDDPMGNNYFSNSPYYVMQDMNGNIVMVPQSEFVVQYWVP